MSVGEYVTLLQACRGASYVILSFRKHSFSCQMQKKESCFIVASYYVCLNNSLFTFTFINGVAPYWQQNTLMG